jgi:death-on-curing protein
VSSPSNWQWLRADLIIAIHDAQLAEHGGTTGIRSLDLLESALARPQATSAYLEGADAIAVGAMYAIAIAHNHPFIDGNKRVAWVAMRTFLELNGVVLIFEPIEAVTEMLALAAGARTDEQFTDWVRRHARLSS